MASPDVLRQAMAASSSPEWTKSGSAHSAPAAAGISKIAMVWDGFTVVGATVGATLWEVRAGLVPSARHLWKGTLFRGDSFAVLMTLLCGFIFALLVISYRMNLYNQHRIYSFLHEQRLAIQACITAGLLLTGAIYLLHALAIPRSIVLITVVLVTGSVSIRRMLFRMLQYRRLERGVGMRNLLIVGTGPEAHALRRHVESIRHFGYSFKGFIEIPGAGFRPGGNSTDVVGDLDTLFERARKYFVDEIFFTIPLERSEMQEVLLKARECGIDLRVMPHTFGGLALNCPIEYVGQFPTIPLHRGSLPEVALTLKRAVDVVLSILVLIGLSPFLLALAILIKLDSSGPVFYFSDRIGKKGRVFKCIKFRTMVADADLRREDLMHLNERDGVLFKISNDPRITKLGRMLRKYSLDELPQFINVLKGDMSIVGPRPPMGSEVREYKLDHLRRLDVMPGITGLWQVQARQDPSFDSYISLDLAYVENWTVWLDLKIILRTIGVVFAGTGS
jgi:exopolysaccharide biosynthesis polyprenyl glycosylphosphotransferase